MTKTFKGRAALRTGVAIALGLAISQAAQADVMSIDFNTLGGWGATPTTVPSVGSLTVSLNQDGTVAARLATAAGTSWYGLGIDTAGYYVVSNATQGQQTGWGTSFGGFNTGLVCSSGACTGPASFTISRSGGFTSVQQLFTGTQSQYDGWFYTTGGEHGGMAAAATGAVPEPATWAMMMLGFGGLGYAMRRRPKAVVGAQIA